VSNPPVHCGIQQDFSVLRRLTEGAPEFLQPGGCLWIVAQEYIPVGSLLAGADGYESIELAACDGRFAVWKACVPGGIRQAKTKKTKAPAARREGTKEPAKKRKKDVEEVVDDEGVGSISDQVAALKQEIKGATDAGEYDNCA